MESLKIKRNIKPFNGDGYSAWKFQIRSLLKELKVLSVIDDEIPEVRSDKWNE